MLFTGTEGGVSKILNKLDLRGVYRKLCVKFGFSISYSIGDLGAQPNGQTDIHTWLIDSAVDADQESIYGRRFFLLHVTYIPTNTINPYTYFLSNEYRKSSKNKTKAAQNISAT